jgi:predicted transcriptional regulator of viral defense system
MANESALLGHYGPELQNQSIDVAIARVAAGQHGVVACWQLKRMGIGDDAVKLRIRNARLHRIYRGVYAVGHTVVPIRGQRMAAVLTAGGGAVLSDRDAAAEWSMLRKTSGRIHVTAPRALRPRRGLLLHCRRLPADEVTCLDGIPITTVPRTIFDLAATEPRRRVEQALHESEVQRLTDALSLPDLVERYPHTPGVRTIRAILAERGAGETITREGLVDLFLAFGDELRFPRPLTDYWITANGRSYECDAVYLEQRVIVELDGYATHSTRRKFESDRVRDRDLQLAGWIVVRVTWHQLRHERDALARDLRRLLARPLAA